VSVDSIHLLRRSASGATYELRPGRFPTAEGGDAVYLSEQVFGYVSPVLVRHFPGFNSYGPSVIRRPIWREIIGDLEMMRGQVERASSVADLRKAGVGFVDPGLDVEFEATFRASADALARLLSDLAVWLDQVLQEQEAVSVLGP